MDQNEKLIMFGVTHMCAVDGYTGKVVGFITLPIKNCVEIYTHFSVSLSYFNKHDRHAIHVHL